MLRSLLLATRTTPRAGVVRLPVVASTASHRCPTSSNSTNNHNTLHCPYQYTSFSAQAAAPKSKPFPPNLKVDPRSSFAPVNKNSEGTAAVASIRVEEEQDDVDTEKVDETRPEGAEASAAEADQEKVDDYDGVGKDEEDDDWFFEPLETTPVIPLPDRLHQTVYNFGPPPSSSSNANEPEQVGTIWLNASIFGKDPIRVDLLKRAVDYHRAKKRGRRNQGGSECGNGTVEQAISPLIGQRGFRGL